MFLLLTNFEIFNLYLFPNMTATASLASQPSAPTQPQLALPQAALLAPGLSTQRQTLPQPQTAVPRSKIEQSLQNIKLALCQSIDSQDLYTKDQNNSIAVHD